MAANEYNVVGKKERKESDESVLFPMPKRHYVAATQDSIVRLYYQETHEAVVGLYTESMMTCLAIIMVGDRGISLIHDTGMLSLKSIQNELKQVGNVLFWAIAYNSNHYKNTQDTDLKEKITRITIPIEEIMGKEMGPKKGDIKMRLYQAPYGFVSVTRQGDINTRENPMGSQIEKVDNYSLRIRINNANNFFLSDTDTVPADIQFNGYRWLSEPIMYKNSKQVEALSHAAKFMRYQIEAPEDWTVVIKRHSYLYQRQQKELSAISIKYKVDRDKSLPSKETVLRRATLKGDMFFVERILLHGALIDDRDPKSGKTALHIAQLKGYTEIKNLLIASGADTEVRDNSWKRPIDYVPVIELSVGSGENAMTEVKLPISVSTALYSIWQKMGKQDSGFFQEKADELKAASQPYPKF